MHNHIWIYTHLHSLDLFNNFCYRLSTFCCRLSTYTVDPQILDTLDCRRLKSLLFCMAQMLWLNSTLMKMGVVWAFWGLNSNVLNRGA
jgi:hypothetical protein